MATLNTDAYNLLVTTFNLTPEQVQYLTTYFENSATLTTMLNTFAADGSELIFDNSSSASFTTGSVATNNAEITIGNVVGANAFDTPDGAFDLATLLAHELAHAVEPGGAIDWSGVSNPSDAAQIALNAEGVALTQEYTVASELNTTLSTTFNMYSGSEVQGIIAAATVSDPVGSAAFTADAMNAGANWAAVNTPSTAQYLND